jgi:hypothetical protein
MPEGKTAVRLNNAATWPKSILKTLDAITCVFTLVYAAARERAAASGSAIVRAFADRDEQAFTAALDKRCFTLLRARWERLPPQKRPLYTPKERAEILQIMRLRYWNTEKIAAYFMVHPNTIGTWRRELNGRGKNSSLFKPPVNKISEAGRWLVHQIRELCPEKNFGTRQITMHVIRAGKKLSRSTTQRILREKKPTPPPTPALPRTQAEAVPPHHILRPEIINRTWHLDLTTVELPLIRFYVAAVVDGFSRKLLALKVYKVSPGPKFLSVYGVK